MRWDVSSVIPSDDDLSLGVQDEQRRHDHGGDRLPEGRVLDLSAA